MKEDHKKQLFEESEKYDSQVSNLKKEFSVATQLWRVQILNLRKEKKSQIQEIVDILGKKFGLKFHNAQHKEEVIEVLVSSKNKLKALIKAYKHCTRKNRHLVRKIRSLYIKFKKLKKATENPIFQNFYYNSTTHQNPQNLQNNSYDYDTNENPEQQQKIIINRFKPHSVVSLEGWEENKFGALKHDFSKQKVDDSLLSKMNQSQLTQSNYNTGHHFNGKSIRESSKFSSEVFNKNRKISEEEYFEAEDNIFSPIIRKTKSGFQPKVAFSPYRNHQKREESPFQRNEKNQKKQIFGSNDENVFSDFTPKSNPNPNPSPIGIGIGVRSMEDSNIGRYQKIASKTREYDNDGFESDTIISPLKVPKVFKMDKNHQINKNNSTGNNLKGRGRERENMKKLRISENGDNSDEHIRIQNFSSDNVYTSKEARNQLIKNIPELNLGEKNSKKNHVFENAFETIKEIESNIAQSIYVDSLRNVVNVEKKVNWGKEIPKMEKEEEKNLENFETIISDEMEQELKFDSKYNYKTSSGVEEVEKGQKSQKMHFANFQKSKKNGIPDDITFLIECLKQKREEKLLINFN